MIKNEKLKEKEKKVKASKIPAKSLATVMRVVDYGIRKHGISSYNDYPIELFEDALARHFVAVLDDYKSIDEDSGLPQLAHLISCGMLLLEKSLNEDNITLNDIINKRYFNKNKVDNE